MAKVREEILMEFMNVSSKLRKFMATHGPLPHGPNTHLEDKMATALQFHALNLLQKNSKMPVGDLAKELVMSSGAIAQLIDRLVNSKWVMRESDPEDRRVIRLSLTKQGEEHLLEITHNIRAKMRDILSLISEKDVQTMINIQNKIIKNLEKKYDKTN